MTDLLGSFPNIDGVLTQDGMSLGIIRAFEAAGKRAGGASEDEAGE